MPITFRCPDCNKVFNARSRHAGRKTRCPKCDCPIVIPHPPKAQKMATATLDSSVASPPPPPQTTPPPTQTGSEFINGMGMDGVSVALLNQILGSSLDTSAKIRDLAVLSIGQNVLRKNVLNAHGAQTVALDGPYRSNMLGLTDQQKAQIAPFPQAPNSINVNTNVPIVGAGNGSGQQQTPTTPPTTNGGTPVPVTIPTPTPTPVPAPISANGSTPSTPAPAPTGNKWILPAVLGAALLGGAGGVSVAKYYSNTNTTNNPPAVTQPDQPVQPPDKGKDAGVGLKVE